MNYTSRMTALLQQMCRQRNGAVADAMRFYGRALGLNYGVSLPTIRQIARSESRDHGFASYLFLQDVRELRLAALHIAQPELLSADQLDSWAAGIINSEIAEEASFALFSRSEVVNQLFSEWIKSNNPLLLYTALLAAARSEQPQLIWVEQATVALLQTSNSTESYAQHIVAKGIVSLFVALSSKGEDFHRAIAEAATRFSQLQCSDFITEELAWRIDK